MSVLRIAVNGAGGRMGQRIVALASADVQLQVVAALEFDQHPQLGEDAGCIAGCGTLGVPLTAKLEATPDVVIDFSTPRGTETIVRICVERNIPLVVATTGLEPPQEQLVKGAAKSIPLLYAPSMSLAVNLVMKLADVAGRALKDHATGADVEIIERHHRFKEDAPSGTALKFGQIIAEAMGLSRHQHGRHGRPGQRPHDEIGYHAVRTGDNPGEHTIIFGLLGETIELSVKAASRDAYAHGALAAAKFLAKQPPGLYSMADVLGL